MSRIGELLLKNGIIAEEQLNEALEMQKKENKRLGEILIELGYLSSDDLVWMLSEQADRPFVEIRLEMLDETLVKQFPKDILCKKSILPLHETEDKMYVAVGDPANAEVLEDIKKIAKKEVIASGADPVGIRKLLEQFFLAQQVTELKHEAKTTIKITDHAATIEFIDESGKIRRKQSPIRIIVSIGQRKEQNNG